ncbi:MAG: DEAD/DEAH box helicase [Bacteroidota bacterium]
MKFEDFNLHNAQLKALAEAGLETPTVIQERAFSVIMSGKDVVGIAQTGTGKTLAYLLPVVRQWKFRKDPLPQILVLVPTRELVEQVVGEINRITTYQNIVAVGVYGGVNLKRHQATVEDGLDVLVGTPGRVYDLLLAGSFRPKAIRHLILDEVDELLALGFRPQLTKIIDLLPAKRQNLLFSATMTEEVQIVIEDSFNFPVQIEAAPTGTPLENIDQAVYLVPNYRTKLNLLAYILQDAETFKRALVFAPSKRLADLAYEQLEPQFGERVGVIHANKSQNYRFERLRQFDSGKHRILIATDLISRGMDISDVSHVINLDMPEASEDYIHRIGRTGRADKEGASITMVRNEEEAYLAAAEEMMQKTVTRLPFPEEVVLSEELIPEEMPNLRVPNVRVKLATKKAGAFHEKKKKNTKVALNRRQLQEQRGRVKANRRKRRKKKR